MWNVLDHVFTSFQMKYKITDVWSDSKANLPTRHQPVPAAVHCKVRRRKRPPTNTPRIWRDIQVQDPELRQESNDLYEITLPPLIDKVKEMVKWVGPSFTIAL